MIDLHEDVLGLFAEAMLYVPRRAIDVTGLPKATMRVRARKTGRANLGRCTSCGRRGHQAPGCTNYEDWYEAPAWLKSP